MEFLIAFLSLLSLASAQFGFFDQMFGGDGGHEHHQHQQRQQQQNNPTICDKYLCPDTLACVHFPHHCPCAWDANEEKFEMGEGKRICISKGGFKFGEAARKIELARKGLL
ncbi:Long chronological lifespan protein 2 [Epichloe bromicola]|uniref:Long chronological lifespan protein 2 n=1 Tax=Epichloe bromicola TaxID=79588 RepID=A0ABQ0CUA6_9HYPO